MPLTTTTAANTIRELYEPSYVKTVFTNNELMEFFSRFGINKRASEGGTAFQFKVHTANNGSVEVFTEGAVQPAAGATTFVNASLSWLYIRAMVQVTGHARDALKSNYVNHVMVEMEQALEDIKDLFNTSFMGSTYGLELAVDSSSNYGGITRSAATYWQSVESAVNANISYTDLRDMQESVRDNEHAARPNVILCSLNQESNIYSITGQPATKMIGPTDSAPGLTAHTFNGMPIIALRDWTDTVIMMLDMNPQHWAIVEHRPFNVKEMAPSGDSDIYQLSAAMLLACKNPLKQAKLTAVTA